MSVAVGLAFVLSLLITNQETCSCRVCTLARSSPLTIL
jgi:hypothetical protein